MKPRFVKAAALLAALLFSDPLAGQQREVRGIVADGQGARVPQALVTVGTTGLRALTGPDGTFIINSVPLGVHDVMIAKAGFARRIVRIEVRDASPVDLGVIRLDPVTRSDVMFIGVVVDEETGDPVLGVSVMIDGSASAVTDEDGMFAIGVPVDDRSRALPIVAQRIGYNGLDGTVQIPAGQSQVELRLVLDPSPVELEEIVVEGESRLVPAHMRGFFERRDLGIGTFFTEDEIERINPTAVADLMRRVAGLEVIYTGAIGALDEPVYRFSSSGRRVVGVNEITGAVDYQGCDAALLYIDGLRVTPQSFGLLLQDPKRLAGVEAYRGTMTPPQFDAADSEGNTGCGAIVAWTKSGLPDGAQSPVVLNLFYGNSLNSSTRSGRRMGANLVFRFVGPVELSPGFGVLPDVDAVDPLDTATGWQLLLNIRVRPLGDDSPWYVGGGLTVIKVKHTVVTRGNAFGARPYPMVLTGVNAVLGPVRPFVEVHAVDVLHPRNTDANLFGGIGIKIGG